MLHRYFYAAVALSWAGRAFSAQLVRTADDPGSREQFEEVDEVPLGTVRVAVDATGAAAASPTKISHTHKQNGTQFENLVSVQYQNALHGCKEGMFKCDSHRCLSRLNVCDGLTDCDDRSDEKLCLSQSVSSARRGRLQEYEAGEPVAGEPGTSLEASESAKVNGSKSERLPYLMVKVPGYIPPPKIGYDKFYKWFEVDPVEHLPRIDENQDVDIEVYYLSNGISDPLLAAITIQHTGLGFKVMKRNDEGHKDELYRLDTQYWACQFQGSFGPDRTAEDKVVLNERNLMTWRSRAIVTASKTHHKWHGDWDKGMHIKLGHITPKEFNNAMSIAEEYARTNTYFQLFELIANDGHMVLPASNCETFVKHVAKKAINIDLMSMKNVPIMRQTWYIESYKTINSLKDPDQVNAPHHEDVMGIEANSVLEPQFQKHINEKLLNHYQFRHFLRAQMHKPWTIPIYYGEDGKPFERSDTPLYYMSFFMDTIEVVRNGKPPVKKRITRPHLPKLSDFPLLPKKGAKDATHAVRKAVGAFGELPVAVAAPLTATAAAATLGGIGAGHALKDAADSAIPRTMTKLGNQLTEDLSALNLGTMDETATSFGKTAEQFLTEHKDTANKIRDAVTAAAGDMISDFEESTEKMKAKHPNVQPEAVRAFEILGANANKLNHRVEEMSPVDAAKAFEKAFVQTYDLKKEHGAPHNKPEEHKEKLPRKEWPLMR
eukprot:gnl/MRDRNA2_/MRDRNA2_93303_c0_seq1.p1 gnl/MRDRNA2_/MRDRNA2_93303_c0~~gnl/MRDRNA2_/MRDRNA2_93303_c0_seq1.p1  ORF type:complete len:717 (+),score=122.53 gnl/MRDRNA2_/MRDRNA2_93303_c0_seq1:126-2276(+)